MSNCPNVLDANKPSRELGIHTTVLNEIFHIYIYIYIYIYTQSTQKNNF